MALPNLRRFITSAVGAKEYFPGYFLCMQNTSVRGPRAASNYYTIAHIAVLLVALTAAKTGNKDKIRFVKFFLPNILFLKTEFFEDFL